MNPSGGAQLPDDPGPMPHVHTPAFMSFEHATIGNKLSLKFPTKKYLGEVFNFLVKDEALNFGEIICLAGDFYGNWDVAGNAEQISDKWLSDPSSSKERFKQNAQQLAKDTPNYLKSLMAVIRKEWELISASVKDGEDTAQVYHSHSGSLDIEYTIATAGSYAGLALCNFDHFGKDAIYAYKAGHSVALAQAKEARQTKSFDGLRYAYFLEGFALHFLTDLFSSGHLRTPRRILHLDTLSSLPSFPGDRCAQRMHDEDCENGLFVTNALGDSWAMYGDGQLFNAKSAANLARVTQASQISLDEVFAVYNTGDDQAPGLFAALNRVPDLDKLGHPGNFTPMFKYDEATNTLYRRTHIDERASPSFTVVPQNNHGYAEALRLIDASGSQQNSFPLARNFPRTTPVIQLHKVDNEQYIVNKYGPMTFSDSSRPKPKITTTWNMVSRTTPPFHPDGSNWSSWVYLSTDIILSVAGGKNNNPAETGYAGYKLDFSEGSSNPIQKLWKWENPSSKSIPDSAIAGELSANSQVTAFTPPPTGGASGLYIFNSGVTEEPKGRNVLYATNSGLLIREVININSEGLPSQLLACAAVADSGVRWLFYGWAQDYNEQLLFEAREESGPIIDEQWWRCLAGSLVGRDSTTQIVRLLYGEHAEKDTLQINVLKVGGNPLKVTQAWTKKFNVSSWGSPNENKYVKWLLLDVSQNGNLDLVSLINTDESTLTTVVFPSRGNYTFGEPVVSQIHIPKKNFNPSHFKPILVKPAEFEITRAKEAIVQKTGILQFFDNYQILGARLLGPIEPGSFTYQLKGQIPSIAGQTTTGAGSSGSGWEMEDWPGFLVKPI